MKTAIIIEDELDAQELLSVILKEYCPSIQLTGIAANITEGVQLIESVEPDLVFLDINLGDFTGFQLLDKLENRSFKIIITTAYENFALQAFKYEAIDYVLKPYTPQNIVAAVGRFSKSIQSHHLYDKLDAIINRNINVSKINLPTSDGIILINTEEIIYVMADRAYCLIHLTNGQKKIVSKSLKEIEDVLPDYLFFRSHASHLINLNQVEKYSKEDGGFAVMSDQTQVPIARRRKNEFLELIKFNT